MSNNRVELTRRGFCLCCVASATFAAGGGWMTPKEAYAEAKNIVDMIRADAATARESRRAGRCT